MTVRRVTWRRADEIETDEHATLTVRDGGLSLVGTILGAENGVPHRVEYRVLADGTGLTSAAHVRDLRGFEQRTLTLERSPKGAWKLNGVVDPALRGCTDVDLGATPATNTLPIRRLRLGYGAAQTITVALVRFPELVVERTRQTYTRLDEFTYRYESGTFVGEIVVDEDGLVAAHGPWRRTGLATGPDDTEPLDAGR
jgi:uncharacterized protein